MKRRKFLILTAGFGLAAALPLRAGNMPAVVIEPDARGFLSAAQWQTMDVVLNHLFPSEAAAPGAREICATAWLYNALGMPDVDPAHRKEMREGLLRLEELAREVYRLAFVELDEAQREAVLRQLEKDSAGRAWLQETLRYILEALLIDPVYGANPGAIGWKWLEHRPGFPRPPANKRYFLL